MCPSPRWLQSWVMDFLTTFEWRPWISNLTKVESNFPLLPFHYRRMHPSVKPRNIWFTIPFKTILYPNTTSFIKFKNHVPSQHTLKYLIYFSSFVKLRNTHTNSMIKKQVIGYNMYTHFGKITFICNHQQKYTNIFLNDNQSLSYVNCKALAFAIKSMKTFSSIGCNSQASNLQYMS